MALAPHCALAPNRAEGGRRAASTSLGSKREEGDLGRKTTTSERTESLKKKRMAREEGEQRDRRDRERQRMTTPREETAQGQNGKRKCANDY
jgi:hypothetical protein